VWLEDFETVEEMSAPSWSWSEGPEATAWTVIDPEGRWMGTVDLPPNFTLRAVGKDRLVGVRTDELDVQYVVVLKLTKGP
jgi:hypothetical protein